MLPVVTRRSHILAVLSSDPLNNSDDDEIDVDGDETSKHRTGPLWPLYFDVVIIVISW